MKDFFLLDEYAHSEFFQVPNGPLVYSPKRPCSFSEQGESMIQALIKVSPTFAQITEQVIPLEDQRVPALETFKEIKKVFQEEKLGLPSVH